MLVSEAFSIPAVLRPNDASRATQVFVTNNINLSNQDNRDSVSKILSCLFS